MQGLNFNIQSVNELLLNWVFMLLKGYFTMLKKWLSTNYVHCTGFFLLSNDKLVVKTAF